jgi:hypothetical protein
MKDNERRREVFNAAETVYNCSIIDHPLAHLAPGPQGQRLDQRAKLPDKRVLNYSVHLEEGVAAFSFFRITNA